MSASIRFLLLAAVVLLVVPDALPARAADAPRRRPNVLTHVSMLCGAHMAAFLSLANSPRGGIRHVVSVSVG